MGSPLRILHLEIDPKDSEIVQSMLAAEGIVCDMVRVETRADYLATLEQEEFHLILADCQLSSFDGMEALEIAQEKCAHVPIITLTGRLGEEKAIQSLKSGATDYVIKERISRLAPSVRHALREAADRTKLKQAERVTRMLCSAIDTSVAELIMEERLHTEKRNISVLLSNLTNFTRHAETTKPEILTSDLNRLLQEIEPVLFDYHAHADKFLGHRIMVEFGAPDDCDRHALLAVMAGLKIQQRITQGKFPWQMQIGIATGEAVIGLIGYRRQTYTAVGEVVQRASRIRKMCAYEGVAVDASTHEEVSRFVEARERTVFSFHESNDPEVREKIARYLARLDKKPNDVELLKRTGLLFMDTHHPFQAYQHLGKALQIDPGDEKIKLAYAKTTLKMNQMDATSMRDRQDMLQLYEVLELKNPLMDRERIPQKLYDNYHEEMEKALSYPEDVVLPIEAIDGSVGHSRVVGFLSYALADALDLTHEEKLDILEAGYVADVGKATIPHHLLNRAGSLSMKEFEKIGKHPRESIRILREKGYDKESLFQIILATHEQFSGSGYPMGLSGEAIPIGARIVAVADTYASLTSWRPYRDRWEYHAACAEMKRDTKRGKFDPQVIEVFERLLKI